MATRNAWNTPDLTADGQLLIGSSAGRPSAATITAGSANVTVTNGSGSITVATVSSNSNWIKISTATASVSATIDFTGLSSTYHVYKVVISNLQPATDTVTLYFRTSTNNGSSYDAAASDYQWQGILTTTADNNPSVDNADSEIHLTSSLGTAANENCNLEIIIYDPSSSEYTKIVSEAVYKNTSTVRQVFEAGGYRQSATAVNAIRFLMSSGNISTGNFVLYGLET